MRCIIVLFILTATSNPLFAGKKAFTIIHSNDLHSHLLGFSPNIDYTSHQTGDDETVGGWARIATVIKDIKKNRGNPVFVILFVMLAGACLKIMSVTKKCESETKFLEIVVVF